VSVLFPNVPFSIAGVPAVLRRAQADVDAREALAQAQARSVDQLATKTWGIFTAGGTPVIKPDAIVAVEHAVDYRIADYPIEQGGFESYNKVATPFGIRVAVSKGGTLAERQQFLTAVDALVASLELFDVVTPEKTYVGVNVERSGLSRTASAGAGMLTVELSLREVRRAAKAIFSTTASVPVPDSLAAPVAAPPVQQAPKPTFKPRTTARPTAAKPVSQGSVQPRTVSGARLVTTKSGAQLYVYDKPTG